MFGQLTWAGKMSCVAVVQTFDGEQGHKRMGLLGKPYHVVYE